MGKFGDRIRELRKAKGYSLRQLAPLVGVGFSYLSKVENDKLDFAGTASVSLIHRLADFLEGDEEELLLLAHHVPKRICRSHHRAARGLSCVGFAERGGARASRRESSDLRKVNR